MSDYELEQLRFGFRYGPAVVTRQMSDEKHGVWLDVAGALERVEVRVTPSGRIRVSKAKKNTKGYYDSLVEQGRKR